MASIERTAFPRFKRLSARELHVFHTPQPEEITWAVAGSAIERHCSRLRHQ